MLKFRTNDIVKIDPKAVKAVAERKGEVSILADRWNAVHGSTDEVLGRFVGRFAIDFEGPFSDDTHSQFWIARRHVATVEAVFGEPPCDAWGNELPPELECVDVTFTDGSALSLDGDPDEIGRKLT